MIGESSTRRFRIAFNLVALLAAAAMVLAGWTLYARFERTNEIRSAQQRVWHAVICSIEVEVTKQKLPEARKQAALRFYDRLLTQEVHAPACGLQTRRSR